LPHEHFPTCLISLKSLARVVKLLGAKTLSVANVVTFKIILHFRRRGHALENVFFDGRSTKAKTQEIKITRILLSCHIKNRFGLNYSSRILAEI